MNRSVKIITAGLIGGFFGNGLLGAVFSLPFIKGILYDPSIQSQLFIEVTPVRNVPLSVIGLIILSTLHAYFFSVFSPSIPGRTWLRKGFFWGFTIWAMYWLFQEWFIYHTLLGEPVILNVLELSILLCGSLLEGIIIAFVLAKKRL
jgi:hypothetical protein